MRLKIFLTLLAMFALLLAGCKDDDNPAAAGPGATVYTGVMAGGGVSGSISINIPTPKRAYPSVTTEGDTIQITGTLKLNGGASIPLTGFFVVETEELFLSGGGYTFSGFIEEGTIVGTFNSPAGSGVFSANVGSATNVRNYCGTYQDNPPGEESGFFNMSISGTYLLVIVSPAGGDGSYWAEGSLTDGTNILIYEPGSSTIVVATGTLNTSNNSVSGVYVGDPGGTWSGSPCN